MVSDFSQNFIKIQKYFFFHKTKSIKLWLNLKIEFFSESIYSLSPPKWSDNWKISNSTLSVTVLILIKKNSHRFIHSSFNVCMFLNRVNWIKIDKLLKLFPCPLSCKVIHSINTKRVWYLTGVKYSSSPVMSIDWHFVHDEIDVIKRGLKRGFTSPQFHVWKTVRCYKI